MEQTPWEALKSFLREYDHKDGNYTEVEIEGIKLRKNPDGSITLYDRMLELYAMRGFYKGEARILVEGEFLNDSQTLRVDLRSAPNMLTGNRRGNSYCSVALIYYKHFDNAEMLIIPPGMQSTEITLKTARHFGRPYIAKIKYSGGEVHNVLPGDLQGGDPDVNPDLRGVTAQGGEVRKEIKLDLEKS